MVAYALYKREKLAWLLDREETIDPVPQEEVDAYTVGRATPKAIEGYRAQAQTIIERMQNSLVEEQGKRIVQAYNNQLALDLKNSDERIEQSIDKLVDRYKIDMVAQIKAVQPGWKSAIFMNMLANVLGVVLVAVVVVVLWSLRVGVLKTIGEIAGYDITEKHPATEIAEPKAQSQSIK